MGMCNFKPIYGRKDVLKIKYFRKYYRRGLGFECGMWYFLQPYRQYGLEHVKY